MTIVISYYSLKIISLLQLSKEPFFCLKLIYFPRNFWILQIYFQKFDTFKEKVTLVLWILNQCSFIQGNRIFILLQVQIIIKFKKFCPLNWKVSENKFNNVENALFLLYLCLFTWLIWFLWFRNEHDLVWPNNKTN